MFDGIVSSHAPSIYGMREVKEAIALQLFGGVSKVLPDGVRLRGDIHVLLVGDPSLAKSQSLSLRYVAQIAPRGVYASGTDASGAGLTAAVVKDNWGGGQWSLEAGAISLADQGHLMLDELEKMNDRDRQRMHDALEAQLVTISKAGINATMKARCPVLAAANPKFGRFEAEKTPIEQIDLPPTLLSRFDVIFALRDVPDPARDAELAEAVVGTHRRAERAEADRLENRTTPPSQAPRFDPDFLRKFIAYARQKVTPVLDEQAHRRLVAFYTELRKQGVGDRKPVPITLRQLEGLVRLAEASARSRLSPEATVGDAERAIHVVQQFMKTVAVDNGDQDIDLLFSGTSRGQRDTIGRVREVLAEMQVNEVDGEGVVLNELIVECEKRGMDRDRVQSALAELERVHEVYCPRQGRYRIPS